jgi:hypothetical protein
MYIRYALFPSPHSTVPFVLATIIFFGAHQFTVMNQTLVKLHEHINIW